MTKPELQARYEELFGEKPKHTISKPELEKIIEDAENGNSTDPENAGEHGSETGPEGDGEIIPEESGGFVPLDEPEDSEDLPLVPLKVTDAEIDAQIKAATKVRDGKRHLVYKDGKEVWWRPSVIEVMYASFGPDRITFPENTEYILKNPKRCTNCG